MLNGTCRFPGWGRAIAPESGSISHAKFITMILQLAAGHHRKAAGCLHDSFVLHQFSAVFHGACDFLLHRNGVGGLLQLGLQC